MICNLLLTILTGILTIYIFASWIINHKTEKSDGSGLIRNSFLRLLSLVVAIQTFALFIMKIDYSAATGLANRYTLYHLCLLAAMAILTALIIGVGPFKRRKNTGNK